MMQIDYNTFFRSSTHYFQTHHMLFLSLNFFGFTIVSGGIEFAAFGDWGHQSPQLALTANAIDKTCPDRDFSILLGDNFYPNGVKSVKDPKFKLFTDFVLGKTGKNKRHYVIMGNHDWYGNAQAQIDYTRNSNEWYMPSFYYSEIIKKNGIVLCMIFIDSTYETSPKRMDSVQLQWIDAELSKPECADPDSWRIVSGHHPIYKGRATGGHSASDGKLLALLHKHKVHLHMAGHIHLHSVFRDQDNLTTLVSGATGLHLPADIWRNHDYFQWGSNGKTSAGFMHFLVDNDKININFVTSLSGESMAEFEVSKSRDFKQIPASPQGNDGNSGSGPADPREGKRNAASPSSSHSIRSCVTISLIICSLLPILGY